MPEVSVVVELRVAVEETVDPIGLEQRVAAEGRRAARELYREALRVLDRIATDAAVGARLSSVPGGSCILRAQACPGQNDKGGDPVSEAKDLGPDLCHASRLDVDMAGLPPPLLSDRSMARVDAVEGG